MLLAVDTAGSRCAACLYDLEAGRVLAEADPDIGKGHAERLMDEIGALLAGVGAAYGDLTKLAAVVGPGSFTGLRVGVAAVRGLSLALARPAVAVGTLEAMAEPYRAEGAAVLAVLDAKRGEVYAALHDGNGAEIMPPSALAPAALRGFVAGLPDEAPLVLAGSGAAIAAEALTGRRGLRTEPEAYARIASVARIAAGRGASGPLSPLYLRGADAKPPSRGPIERTVEGQAGESLAGGLSIGEGTGR